MLDSTGGSVGTYPDLDPFEREQRFLLTNDQALAFLAAVRPRVALELYDRARPVSFTRTTYLDTDDSSYLRSCETEGATARRLRLREYALARSFADTPILSGVSFLELKQNAGTTRSKIRISAPPETLERIISGRFERDGARLLEDLPSDGERLSAARAIASELAANRVAPRLTTWYRRTCLTAEGGRVRITLDEGLLFCRPQPLGRPGQPVGPADVVSYGPARILEIKHWGDEPAWLALATAELEPAASFSKFRMGMAGLRPNRVV
jgi:hypothetical protein